MKTKYQILAAAVVFCILANAAQAGLWEIKDAGLQDTVNFIDTGFGTGGFALNSRSDIAGNPGTRLNITLTGSGWNDIMIGDNFDQPTPNAGITAATGNSGDLSGYLGYAMTIHNPGSDAYMVALCMNTGWTDSPWLEPDRYYQNGDGSVTWVGPGQTVTLTLDFGNAALRNGSGWTTGQAVQNLNHVTNIGLKIGGNLGNAGEVQSGVAFDVDIVSLTSLWEIKDAGLQSGDFAQLGGGTLNSKTNIAGDPGTRLNITLTGSGWQDIQIGDNFPVAAATGNGGDLSGYLGYAMTIHNPGSDAFMVTLHMNTGWTDSPWLEPDRYYQNGDGSVTWVGPGQTVKLTLDFGNAALWNGSGWTTGQAVQNLNHVTNIGLKVGGNLGNAGEVQSGVAFDVDIVSNILELNVEAPSLYVQPAETVVVDMDVKHLLQRVNGCQAMLGYNSTYLSAGTVLPGGGVWDLVIYESWAVSGEIDTAIGVNAYGSTGTDADGTVAKINLIAGSTEGTTKLVFRADASPDPGLVKSTFLSDMSANPVWPVKYDSQIIVIDGTAPSINIASAKQGGQELLISLGSSINAIQGVVNIQVTASDALAGLSGPPTVTVTPSGGSAENATYVNESPAGTFNYTWSVTVSTNNGTATINASVSDNSGNSNSDSDTFNVNKNQITGTVSMATYLSVSYSFNRNVVFSATDSGGSVLKNWTQTVSFSNSSGTASGSYVLTDVPSGTANLSAKTDWSLRQRQAVSFDGNSQATVNFTVLGGDLDNSNSVNVLDYSIFKVNYGTGNAVADINGNGAVDAVDYFILKINFFKVGDAE